MGEVSGCPAALVPELTRAASVLRRRGRPHCWVFESADITQGAAVFLPGGGSFYKSPCPLYRGYWLLGGCGAVSCALSGRPLPGAAYYELCEKESRACPLRQGAGQDEGPGQMSLEGF